MSTYKSLKYDSLGIPLVKSMKYCSMSSTRGKVVPSPDGYDEWTWMKIKM